MFFRHKRSGHTEYLQIVKNERVDGKPRQSVVATLGRVDELAQDGTLDRLLRKANSRSSTRSLVVRGPRPRPLWSASSSPSQPMAR